MRITTAAIGVLGFGAQSGRALISGPSSALRSRRVHPSVGGLRHVVSMNFFSALSGIGTKKEIDYSQLVGLPMSFAKEAGENALGNVIPVTSKDGKYKVATFSGGCFWGFELAFQRMPGVIATCVGYCQGKTEKPTYNEVCSESTGHTEAIQVIFNEAEVSYTELLDLFWQRLGSDATRLNQVGNDFGTQYRHGIYCHTSEQLQLAQQSLSSQQANFRSQIMTEVEPVAIFWPAEEYHQQYLEKGGRFGVPQSAEKGATETIRCYG